MCNQRVFILVTTGLLVSSLLLECAGTDKPAADESPAEDDWTLPAWVQPSSNSGFFSELASPQHQVNLRVVDFTWRQLEPSEGQFSTTTADEVYGMAFASWDEQLAGNDPFWLRLWISGTEWAPQWMQTECGVSTVANGYENDPHLPIWNACMWSHARQFYREVLLTRGLGADPRMRFVYVPGAFTWCEFDFDIISAAVQQGTVDFATFNAWFQQAMVDLVWIMNQENSDPSDDNAWKLVYTGEDYPFGPFDASDDMLARDAVVAGMGIRTGITELFNFHLNDVPAYGTRIAQDAHLVTDDETWPLFDGKRTIGTENECYNDCGYSTSEPYYAVKMSNLKALQLRVNWLYVVPSTSYLAEYASFWNWVRLSLGKTAADSADAWVALREAEDRYWLDDPVISWPASPWVRNLERWLIQREVSPDGLTLRGQEVRSSVLDPENGTAYEGRSTDHASGSDYIYFDLDDRFLHRRSDPVDIKVTYLDAGTGPWLIQYAGVNGLTATPPVTRTNSGGYMTATVRIEDGYFDDSLAGSCDFRLFDGGADDLEVRFVRVVKMNPPAMVPGGIAGFWGLAGALLGMGGTVVLPSALSRRPGGLRRLRRFAPSRVPPQAR